MNDLFSLKDKIIVVTGGTGVLGKSFVKGIAAAGGTVVIIGRDINKANVIAEEININGGKAMPISADVLSEAQMVLAKEKIISEYGKIDGLVNAAGGNTPEGVLQNDADIFDISIEGMKNAMVLNIWGTVIPTQIFGSAMAMNGGGSIVNISSVSPKRALTRVLGYSMGKAAIDAYNQWFAVEMANRFGDTIRMNAIMPGFFLTEQNRTLLTNTDGSLTERGNSIISNTPFKRFGNPDELIGALVFLLSDAAAFVTGTQIGVDGGFSAFSGV